MFKLFHLNECPTNPMEPGRGEQIKLINPSLGTEKVDVHLNRLVPGGPRGKHHHHTEVCESACRCQTGFADDH